MKTSQKKKCCYFFCDEDVVEDKALRLSFKSQDFGLETFLVKGNNMENIANYCRNLKHEIGYKLISLYVQYSLCTTKISWVVTPYCKREKNSFEWQQLAKQQ